VAAAPFAPPARSAMHVDQQRIMLSSPKLGLCDSEVRHLVDREVGGIPASSL
jgi:hypothetical protein